MPALKAWKTGCLVAALFISSFNASNLLAADQDQLDRVRKFSIGSAAARSFGAANKAKKTAANDSAAASEVGQEAAGVSAEQQAREDIEQAENSAKPFGSTLFGGQFARERPGGLNPQYKIAPGDQVSVNLFGAQTFNAIVPVDAQGNLFIPEVGPVAVAGVSNRSLQRVVEAKVGQVFTDNVKVYVNLLGAQTLGVFVTGAVRAPGRYGGLPSDSLLAFIDKAGGVDLERGSFRNVTILRDRQQIAKADLYAFLLDGSLPTPQFKNGDVIVVGPIGGAVAVGGEARSTAAFEFEAFPIRGHDLAAYARPKSDVTHVALSGFRAGQPFNTYLPYAEFLEATLEDGDLVDFQADLKAQDVFVEVEGEHLGASRLAIARGAMLESVLDLIPIDPSVAATHSIFLRRESVARDQKRALDRSLDELERTALAALSQTSSQAEIRNSEAQLVLEFIKRARTIEPDGRVVVSTDAGRSNVRMEAGDQIIIPQKTDLVLISGEVTLPQSVAFIPGASIRDYVERAGGFAERGDASKVITIRAGGEAVRGVNTVVQRGDQILVLPYVDTKFFQVASDIGQILFRIAIIAATVIAL